MTNVLLVLAISVISHVPSWVLVPHFKVFFLIVHHHLFNLHTHRVFVALPSRFPPSSLFLFTFHAPHVSQHTSSLCREDKVPPASLLTVLKLGGVKELETNLPSPVGG